jgi:hypothetical protein
MKEDFHYIWRFKKFNILDLKTHQGEPYLSNVGQYLELSGPDFFNAQLNRIKMGRKCEIHIKSSDWYVHHEKMSTIVIFM